MRPHFYSFDKARAPVAKDICPNKLQRKGGATWGWPGPTERPKEGEQGPLAHGPRRWLGLVPQVRKGPAQDPKPDSWWRKRVGVRESEGGVSRVSPTPPAMLCLNTT